MRYIRQIDENVFLNRRDFLFVLNAEWAMPIV